MLQQKDCPMVKSKQVLLGKIKEDVSSMSLICQRIQLKADRCISFWENLAKSQIDHLLRLHAFRNLPQLFNNFGKISGLPSWGNNVFFDELKISQNKNDTRQPSECQAFKNCPPKNSHENKNIETFFASHEILLGLSFREF